MNDWVKLSCDEQNFIKQILAFFAGSDTIVNDNLIKHMQREIQVLEVQYFYGFQIAIENIHSEMYSILIRKFSKDLNEENFLLNSITQNKTIQLKANWVMKWINNENVSFTKRIVAGAITEGIFFSGSFASIFWLKQRGIMPGLTFSNELISRDEGLHYKFATLLYNYVKNRLSKEEAEEIVKEAVEIELEFMSSVLPVSMIGMNAESMHDYIKYVADRLLIDFGYEKIYKVKNPFAFMELSSMQGKTNFFERRVGEYSRIQSSSILETDDKLKNASIETPYTRDDLFSGNIDF